MADSGGIRVEGAEKWNPFKSESSMSWTEYRQLRPQYPNKIYDTIARYMEQHNHTDRQLCIDYGSGTGTVVEPVLQRLGVTKVLATDLNARQLREGEIQLRDLYGPQKYETAVGAAGELHDIPDNSVDLVTAAEAAHHFPMSQWQREVARILRPSGTLAFWHYPAQLFILSHPEANSACNRIFERFFESVVPKGTASLDKVLYSVTLLDSVIVDPGAFLHQARYQWRIPRMISDRVPKVAELRMNDEPYTEDRARAGLSATPNVKVEIFVPENAKETLIRRADWTTNTLVRYLHTMGVTVETLLSDKVFQQSIQEIESLVGGPEGTFDVGWEIALFLGTKDDHHSRS